ncbi:dicer-like 2 protein [Striga asiatica]|uniref:Dicer-like 2 protein n=1 Tax=Striga asiatica TaxID=4170 RepID=A0A5A7P6V3_STRAF|nr:dicer-like 2 protein [Striga asiatica]
MENTNMSENGGNQQVVADPVHFARSYQLEALEKALKQNTIVFFETGTGKTLIAIMLLRSYAHLIRKPSVYAAVFLVPTVVLVNQQSEVVSMHTDLKVGKYYGDMGVDYWNAPTWKQQVEKHEVLVMTPQILLNALRHRFLRLDQIKVLIFDECHNARGKHSYACIMTEFYHRELASNTLQLPRVFGMTASPIKAKASSSEAEYWKQIKELENLMQSKVFTCDSEHVLSQHVPFSTTKVKAYDHMEIPHMTVKRLEDHLQKMVGKQQSSLDEASISESVANSAKKRLSKLFSTFMFCLTELGIWLAMKAAEYYSVEGDDDVFVWGKMHVSGEKVVRGFSSEAVKIFSASMPSGAKWSIRNDLMANITAGYLTSKVMCLVETLLDYKNLKDLRCIVFVERIVTAVVIRNLLNELLPQLVGWRTEYTAGNNSKIQSQSRKEQNAIVDEFRKGTVNIIIATSMLEEGLDVQSCNLVIRFDPSATICSFIQSRGRARMPNSDFVLMVKRDDSSALSRVNKYLASGDIMRKECLSHSHLPCEPLQSEMYGESWYEVKSTGAIVTMSSSVGLLYYYCSRLPSDRYFKPNPYCDINKELGTCTLHLPSSCPIQTITVQGNPKFLKKLACLEACKKLHELGALTDNLIPDIVEEEAEAEAAAVEYGNVSYMDKHPKYYPQELVGSHGNLSETVFHCYLIVLQPNFQYDVKFQDVLLAVHKRLDNDLESFDIDLDADRGSVVAHVKYFGYVSLSPEQVLLCRKFQTTLFRVLIDHNFTKLKKCGQSPEVNGSSIGLNYLLLPVVKSDQGMSIDWSSINSVRFPENASQHFRTDCSSRQNYDSHMPTKDGLVCRCMIENSLVLTPHNGVLYCVMGTLEGIDGNSYLELRDGEAVTYKKYFKTRHGINLQYELETLLKGKRVFSVHNYLQRSRTASKKEPSNSSCELPPELCSIIMSPVSISTFYSFSFLPSVMHRVESLLIAANLRCMALGLCTHQNVIPTLRVLEGITTKKCQEKLHLESLETLGDSFLKYAVSQQLFKTYENRHEGLLSIKREKIICNATLCKLGCLRKITGFIRNEPLDIKTWIIPGAYNPDHILQEEMLSSKKVYIGRSRKIKSKTVADVTEALIGAFLSAGGEIAALSFMTWIGISVEFVSVPCTRNMCTHPELFLNIRHLESLLGYKFQDVSLLVEALTHGSFMRQEVPGCYQVLGDIIESLAGAIFVDSGYDKEIVFQSMKPLLEPLITPETLRIHPVRELTELCQREHFIFKKPLISRKNGTTYATVEAEAHGVVYKETRSSVDKKMAKKLACKAVLMSLKESIFAEMKS